MPEKKKIAIVGATGYTGSELLRILVHHPEVEIVMTTSESRKGERISDVHPFLRGILEIELHSVKDLNKSSPDLVFLALPHGVSMEYVREFSDKPFKIVDLSGDFRLSSPEVYKVWYGKEHVFTEGFKNAVFGLPELFLPEIEKAQLVANPGCYPTCSILGLAPLFKNRAVLPESVIIDAKSGITGAGNKAKSANQFSNVNENFKAYGIKTHRHSIEIAETLEKISGESLSLQFTPHLLPLDRGILSTIYARPKENLTEKDIRGMYMVFYKDKPFVRLRENPPSIKDVRGSNYCDIYTTFDEHTGNIIVISVIDNLVKGAAGQAVQNMNLMFGFEESTGLNNTPLNP